jgi:hypothetical protein
VKTQQELDLDIPKLKNGKPTVVEIETNDSLSNYIKNTIVERANKIKNRQVDPSVDNMLKLTGDLRKASLDMRLIDPTVPEAVAGGKIKAVADNIFAKWKESSDTLGAQLVFCDLSTPKGVDDKKVAKEGEVLAVTVSSEEVAAGLLATTDIPAEVHVRVEEARIVLAELYEHCVCIIKRLALGYGHILCCLAWLLAGASVIFNADVVSDLSELPDHLRSRREEEECRVDLRTLHTCREVNRGSAVIPLAFVIGPLLVVAFLEAYERTERHIVILHSRVSVKAIGHAGEIRLGHIPLHGLGVWMIHVPPHLDAVLSEFPILVIDKMLADHHCIIVNGLDMSIILLDDIHA